MEFSSYNLYRVSTITIYVYVRSFLDYLLFGDEVEEEDMLHVKEECGS